jgi:hypothetical protein
MRIFSENLIKIFSEIYALVSSAKFSAEYVESLSPIERTLLLNSHISYQKESMGGGSNETNRPSIGKESLPNSDLLGNLEDYMG